MMGAVHRVVLQGGAPKLMPFYPSVGGNVILEAAWEGFLETLQDSMEELRHLVKHPVQTNDVGRSGSLLGGFLLVAERTKLPLRLLEIGTSAGLNLAWDRYRYEWKGGAWGNPESSVRLQNVFIEAPPRFVPAVEIASRAGCDPHPSCFASWTGSARHSGAVIYSLHPAFDMRTHESVC
jgi:hypothetical protein